MNELKGIYIEGTGKTPKIEFTQPTGELVLDGRSIPENAAKVYQPLLDWVEEYVKSPCVTTNLNLKLEYFNTSSLLWITKIIIALCNIELPKAIIYVHLYFEIEDFEDGITDDVRSIIYQISDKIHSKEKSNIAIITHGTDGKGRILKESTILI
ncbi:MAG: SiaC family regulatory phosphoprotein [Methanococcaceae archaeon]